MIEKNIFQLSKHKNPTFFLRRYVKSFQNQSGFNYYIYTDQDMDEFIVNVFPEYLSEYNSLSIIEKTDLVRLLLVFHFGGIYSDLDTLCKVDLDHLFNEFEDAELLVGLEADVDEETRKLYGLVRNKQICNWTFAAKRGNNALKKIIDQVITNIQKYPKSKPLDKTGPGPFSDIVFSYEPKNKIVVLPIKYFCAGVPYEPKSLLQEAYIVHKFWGSWKSVPLEYKMVLIIEGIFGEDFRNILLSYYNKMLKW